VRLLAHGFGEAPGRHSHTVLSAVVDEDAAGLAEPAGDDEVGDAVGDAVL
jgi:hypothetical protein